MPFPDFITPPTHAEVVLFDSAGVPYFNPQWLRWFVDLARVLTAGGAASTGLGTVHSVAVAVPAVILSSSGGPITVSGTITLSLANPVTGTGGIVLQTSASVSKHSVSDYLDFVAQGSNPPAPAAGVVRFHSATTQGFTRFEQDNEAATNLVLGRDNVFIAKNTSVATIAKGKAVYTSGSTGNVPNIGLAKADSISTMPAIGVVLDDIPSNNFGQVMKLGIVASSNTASFATGALLYVSDTTAGDLTASRPAPPNLIQIMANVLVSGTGNGSLFVITAPFVGNLDPWGLVRRSVAAGETLQIASGYQAVFASDLTNNGTINNSGVLLII